MRLDARHAFLALTLVLAYSCALRATGAPVERDGRDVMHYLFPGELEGADRAAKLVEEEDGRFLYVVEGATRCVVNLGRASFQEFGDHVVFYFEDFGAPGSPLLSSCRVTKTEEIMDIVVRDARRRIQASKETSVVGSLDRILERLVLLRESVNAQSILHLVSAIAYTTLLGFLMLGLLFTCAKR